MTDWVLGLCLASSMLKNSEEHNGSEIGYFRYRLKGWETPTLLGPLERSNFIQSQSQSFTLWPAVYRQSVDLGDKPLETHDQ
jgi:hypothetical protein